MIGVTKTVWAITIASGVNSRPHDPRGPERDSIQINRQARHHRWQSHQGVEHDNYRFSATKSGKCDQRAQCTPISAAMNVALRLTISDSRTMAKRVGSPVSTRWRAEAFRAWLILAVYDRALSFCNVRSALFALSALITANSVA